MPDLLPPADNLRQEQLNILQLQKPLAEKAAVYKLCLAELSASREIEQLSSYLLVFDGAAAAKWLQTWKSSHKHSDMKRFLWL